VQSGPSSLHCPGPRNFARILLCGRWVILNVLLGLFLLVILFFLLFGLILRDTRAHKLLWLPLLSSWLRGIVGCGRTATIFGSGVLLVAI